VIPYEAETPALTPESATAAAPASISESIPAPAPASIVRERPVGSPTEFFESLLVTILLALFGTTFIVQAFKIPSESMQPTLLVGDHLLNGVCRQVDMFLLRRREAAQIMTVAPAQAAGDELRTAGDQPEM